MKSTIQKISTLIILFLSLFSFSSTYGQTITTGTVSPYLVCTGNSIIVPFVATGNFNQNDFFNVQLSNTTGGFTTFTTIASVQIQNPISSSFSGTITANIPSAMVGSTQYRVRVVYVVSGATTPSVVGARNPSNIIISRTRFNPSFTLPTSICSGTSLTLPTTSTNNVTGTWSPAFNNIVTTNTTTNYTFTPTAGLCANVATRAITVNANVTPTFSPVSAVCSGNTMTALPTTSTNNVTGSWSPALNNTATTTYTFTPTVGLCALTTAATIVVNPRVTPLFDEFTAKCAGEISSGLPQSSLNGISGLWSPAYNNQVTTAYTFTPNTSFCANSTTATQVINPAVTPLFNQIPPICAGNSFTLPTVSENGISGTWSPAINNTSTTTYTFTPSNGTCATTSTMTVVVNPIITPSFNQVAAICSGDSFSLPTVSENGISGSWSPELNFTETTTYTFTPSNGSCTNISTMTVVVSPIVTPTFNQVTAVCSGDSFTLLTESENGISGTWSPALNNTVTTTYTFTPSIVSCANSSQMTVVVNPRVEPIFDAFAAVCFGTDLAQLPLTSLNGINGTWFPSLNNMSTTTYTFTPNAEVCANSINETLVINPSITNDTAITAIFNYTWPLTGETYTTSGVYTHVSNCIETILNLTILENCIIETPGVITGTSIGLCEEGITNPSYSIEAVNFATGYEWTAPPGAEIVSGQGTTTITLNILPNFTEGNLSVRAFNFCDTSELKLLYIRSVFYTPLTPVGQTSGLCTQGVSTVVFNAAVVSGITSYIWTAPEGTNIISGQGTSTIELNISDNFSLGNLRLITNNVCGSSAERVVILRSVLGQPGLISGTAVGLCQDGISTVTYSVPAQAVAISYTWTAPFGTSIQSGQGTNTIELSVQEGFTFGNLSVVANTLCGSSIARTLTIRSTLIQPVQITGPTVGLCSQGISLATYSIPNQVGATGYIWTAPAGTSIVSGQGSNSIELSILEGFSIGNLSVVATNSCGSSSPSTLSIRSTLTQLGAISGTTFGVCSQGTPSLTYSVPIQAGAIDYTWSIPTGTTIESGQGTNSIVLNIQNNFSFGNISVVSNNQCGSSLTRVSSIFSTPSTPGTITGTTNSLCPSGVNNPTYTIAAVVGASSYTWTAPTGTSIVSGQGTNSITLSVSNNFVSGNLNVVANNSCGSSTTRTLALTSIPATPGVITGTTNNLCPNGVSNPTYTIASVTGALSYTWTAPSGTTIVSGQGTNSITLNITNSFVSGTLRVVTNNACGSSTSRTLSLSSIPSSPGTITGTSNNLCPNGVSNPTYSIAAVAGASSYTWTAPAGTTIVSGQGTTSVTLEISNSFSAGTLSVVSNNSCSSSVARTLALTNTPLTPTSITGSSTPCGIENYTCTSVAQAVSYTWTVPIGMEITAGQGTNSITVNVIASSVSGNISVRASNNCRIGNTRSLAVNSCNISSRMAENSIIQAINENDVEVSVFPNPTNDKIDVQLSNEFNENVKIELINLIGQKVSEVEIQKGNKTTSTTLEGMPAGIYLLQALKLDGTLIYTTKILKQ